IFGEWSYTPGLIRLLRRIGQGDPFLSRKQRLTIWLAAAAMTVASLGVPLPGTRAPRSGDPFPCQHCACGCSDAETCWRRCCCFTNAQKIAWAEKNGVKVPVYVAAAARREQASAVVQSCCLEQPASLAA